MGRWAVSGDDELPAVHALQDATTLTPRNPDAVPAGLALPDPGVPESALFLEKLRVWSQQFPPAPRDRPLQASLASTGIAVVGDSPEVNGWKLTFHAFDYNLDYFEIGALDDDRFKIIDPEVRIPERAAAALGGLWGNHPYEAAYIVSYVDDHGDQLAGERTYTLRLDPEPPVSAFWSLTMYSVPDFYLVENPIERYSIGDRTPGLVRDEDGALTITMSHERPADERAAANWLPSPAGDFRPMMRMYEPAPAVLEGHYTVPAITRSAG